VTRSGDALTRLRMYQVDAFADRLFTGNPAAVIITPAPLPEALMQSVASENNLAETAFAVPTGSDRWDLRWFTPVHEAGFCGHATLATAHTLRTYFDAGKALHFETKAGPIPVTFSSEGYVLDLPRHDPQPLTQLPEAIADIFAGPLVDQFQNFENYFARLPDCAAVEAFEPDLVRIARLGDRGLVVTAAGDRAAASDGPDFVSRYFAPGAGIPEDPVTGSTHATLVPYWAQQLGRKHLRAYQASQRGGWLHCCLAQNRVLVRGNAVVFMEADIFVPAHEKAAQ